jgi:hypothetical protein
MWESHDHLDQILNQVQVFHVNDKSSLFISLACDFPNIGGKNFNGSILSVAVVKKRQIWFVQSCDFHIR